MNIVILYGKIVDNIDFKFIYNKYSKNLEIRNKTSIVKFTMKLENGSITKVYSYDEIADFIYRKLHKNNSVLIEGSLDSNGDIECKIIYMIF